MIDQITTDGRPQSGRDHHPEAVDAQSHPPAAGGIDTKDQHHGQRLDDAGTTTLGDAQGNQLPGLIGRQSQQRTEHEQPQTQQHGQARAEPLLSPVGQQQAGSHCREETGRQPLGQWPAYGKVIHDRREGHIDAGGGQHQGHAAQHQQTEQPERVSGAVARLQLRQIGRHQSCSRLASMRE